MDHCTEKFKFLYDVLSNGNYHNSIFWYIQWDCSWWAQFLSCKRNKQREFPVMKTGLLIACEEKERVWFESVEILLYPPFMKHHQRNGTIKRIPRFFYCYEKINYQLHSIHIKNNSYAISRNIRDNAVCVYHEIGNEQRLIYSFPFCRQQIFTFDIHVYVR